MKIRGHIHLIASGKGETMQYCYSCMESIETEQICPKCGFHLNDYRAASHHLKPGTLLRNQFYTVGKVLGEGGFGITYVGRHPVFERKVAIKEFFMSGYVMRDHTISNDLRTGNSAEIFFKNREKFLEEARRLAKFEGDGSIVGVRDFFEENNTAYLVMDFVEGITLRKYVEQYGKLSDTRILELLDPIFYSLASVHEHGLIHRDISPDNIMLTNDGKVKLLDFGAAREVALGDFKSLSIILKPGYAPEEQYRSKGKQGPWTDVYALCATIYRCVTGVVPDDAMERLFEDHLIPPSELDCDCSQTVSDVLMKGLSVRQTNRYQSIPELWDALHPTATSETSAEEATKTIVVEEISDIPTKSEQSTIRKTSPKKESNEIVVTEETLDTPKQVEQKSQRITKTAKRLYNRGESYLSIQLYQKAIPYLQKAAEQGHTIAQYKLGSFYESGLGVEKNPAKAVEWFQKSAEQEYTPAQYALGRCYLKGIGTKKDLIESGKWYRKWYHKVSEQKSGKNKKILLKLGHCCAYGNGIDIDYVKAVEWYRQSAEKGHAPAQYYLGRHYHQGRGVEKDIGIAISWYQKAAEQNYPYAQNELGGCYARGIYVTQDWGQATKLFRRAAEQDLMEAQFNLGLCYEYGQGVKRDLGEAEMWYNKADKKGHPNAQEALQRIKKQQSASAKKAPSK